MLQLPFRFKDPSARGKILSLFRAASLALPLPSLAMNMGYPSKLSGAVLDIHYIKVIYILNQYIIY